MKKFLLMFMAVFTMAANAQEVVLIEPNKPFNYELNVDTVKYPYLKDVEVNWFLGFEEIESETGAKVCAQKISSVVTLDDETKLLHIEEVPNMPKTMDLFYTHRVETTKAIVADETGNYYYTRDEFDGFICDTVAVLHILTDLTKIEKPEDVVNSFLVNGEKNEVTKLTVGDTVKITVEAVNELDIQKYILKVDTTIIAESDSGYFELTPTETIENLQLVVANKTGEYTIPYTKTLEVYPKFDIVTTTYTISRGGEVITKSDTIKEVEVNVFNHDAVTLSVETNIDKVKDPDGISYTWNKDGKPVQFYKETLTIDEYVKSDMDGVYNCLVTYKDTTVMASFTIKSEFPTSNEVISNVSVTVSNDNIVVNNASGKTVRVVDTMGRVIYTKMLESSGFQVRVPSGIYFVIVENKTYKVSL